MTQTATDLLTKLQSTRFDSEAQGPSHLQDNLTTKLPFLTVDTNFSRPVECSLQQPSSRDPLRQSTENTECRDNDGKTSNQDVHRLPSTSLALHGIPPEGHSITLGTARPAPYHSGSNHNSNNVDIIGVTTPRVIVTSAENDLYIPSLIEPGFTAPRCRVPSSVYSCYTDVDLQRAGSDTVPPVPHIPSHLQHSNNTSMHRSVSFERSSAQGISAGPLCTAVASPHRDSKGWWNFVTSPFSANTTSDFWRSPVPGCEEQTPILSDIQETPIDDGQNRECVESSRVMSKHIIVDQNDIRRASAATVDIYYIPLQGEAGPYYDKSRHFPSLFLDRHLIPDQATINDVTSSTRRPAYPDVGHQRTDADDTDPSEEASHGRSVSNQAHSTSDPVAFSSPHLEELLTPAFHFATHDHCMKSEQRSLTSLSRSSSLTGHTPITHGIGGDESHEECKTGEAHPRQMASLHLPKGLAANTMASRPLAEDPTTSTPRGMDLDHSRALQHGRNGSFGLGISGGEKEEIPEVPEPDVMEKLGNTKGMTCAQRLQWPVVTLSFAVMALIVTLLVMYVPQQRQDAPVQAQWVNLTGFPPLAVGVTTAVEPRNVRNVNKCTASPQLWACDATTDSGETHPTSNNTLPTFRFEIRFENDTAMNSSMLQSQHRRRFTVSGSPSTSSRAIRAVVARDYWSDNLFSPSPAPPTVADQVFLGNTTDNNTFPFEGEVTPFYISLLDPTPIEADRLLQKRQNEVYPLPQSDGGSAQATIASGSTIPRPPPNGVHGQAVSVSLPLATAQPLRLYKRGMPDEHYGFYMYYDRSLLVPGDGLPSTARSNASSLCVWSQTRLLVQIWTKGYLSGNSMIANEGGSSAIIAAVNSTADDMESPGSFPHPVSITIDRHGGDPGRKGVYCYELDSEGHIEQGVGVWVSEDRAYGGMLVDAAAVPGSNSSTSSSTGSGNYGGIDGGTGGCACAWQNW